MRVFLLEKNDGYNEKGHDVLARMLGETREMKKRRAKFPWHGGPLAVFRCEAAAYEATSAVLRNCSVSMGLDR